MDPTVQVAIVVGIFGLLSVVLTKILDWTKERKAKIVRTQEREANVNGAATLLTRNDRYMAWLELENDRLVAELQQCRGESQ